jgi:Zn-dependent protease
MLKQKEYAVISIVAFFLAFSFSLFNLGNLLKYFLIFLGLVFVYVFSQKLMAYYFESETETKVWLEGRYGIKKGQYLKSPLPIGLILCFVFPFLSYGRAKWLALTETEVVARKERVARRHGFYSFPDLTEFHIAMICAGGVFAMFFISLLSYLLNLPVEISKLAMYFAFFNLIPFSKIDGSKIFFGAPFLWCFLFLIALIFSLLLSFMI